MEDFAAWFGLLLERRELSQEAAARALEVSVTTIRRWLNGYSDPRYRELLGIYRVFGEHPFPRKGSTG